MSDIQVGDPLVFGLIPTEENHAQHGFLHSFLYRNNYLSGRGGGKTTGLVAKNAAYALGINPGSTSYLTEQTGPMVRDILLPVVREVVPKELYYIRTVSSTHFDIHWINGSTTRLRSRQVKNSTEDPPFRGPSAAYIGHDEAALDRRGKKMIEVSEAMLRGGSGPFVMDCVSTPKLGWMHEYLARWNLTGEEAVQISDDGDAVAFYGTTADNPHNNDLDTRLRETYSADFAAQELDARWISLTGRIWNTFQKAQWPEGNIHWNRYNRNEPYALAVDLGVRAAWQIWQTVPARDIAGRQIFNTYLEVLVAEYTPNHGNARDLVKLIDLEYGRPAVVYAGSDIKTRGVSDGLKPAYFFSSQWPGIELHSPTGYLTDKEIQHWVAQSRICNAYGQRLMCVSEDLVSHDNNGRGLLDVLSLDAWPDGQPRYGSFFEKDKASGGIGLEDSRDAFLYYMICRHPPEIRRERRAA
jgi:hypothetical protein